MGILDIELNNNPNKGGLFESSFFLGRGVNLTPPLYFKKNSSNINIYTVVK